MAFGKQFAASAQKEQSVQTAHIAEHASDEVSHTGPKSEPESVNGLGSEKPSGASGAPTRRINGRFNGTEASSSTPAPLRRRISVPGSPNTFVRSNVSAPSPASIPTAPSRGGFSSTAVVAGVSRPLPVAGSLRLDYLISLVVTHQGLRKDEEVALRKEASENPDAVQARLDAIYKNEIAPVRKKAVKNMSEAIEENPDAVVSLFIIGTRQNVKVWPREQAKGLALLHGATVERVHASRTPFQKPSVVFAAPEQETHVPSEDTAFTQSSSGPRP